jgi:hypothetical protein
MKNPLKKFFKPKLKLVRGTRFVSFLFIAFSVIIAAGFLFAANMYYNIDTGEVVMEEVNRVTGLVKAVGGLVVGQDKTLPSGVAFEVATTSDVLLSGVNQVLRFSGGTSYYVGFKAPTTTTSTKTYILPQHGTNPPSSDYVLTYQTGDQLTWKSIGGAGGGDINAVGDCSTGDCFTEAGTGNTLYFEGSTVDTNEIMLTAADPGADYTITLPAANGTVALGTSTANYVAYWTATNTLAGEAQLATSRGGIGANSAAWNGMVKVVGGSWSTATGTAGYAAYWSDANTIGSEQFLTVPRGGTGAGSFTQNGILYGNTAGTLGVTAAGTADYLLVGSGTGSAPTWKYLYQILTAGNNINLTGTTNVTIATVNNPTFSTSVTSPQFLSTTTLAIQSGNSQDITIDSASGKIVLGSGDYIQTALGYEIGKTGTEILREMIPILGFEMPVRCGAACETATTVSRTIEDYPFSSVATGTDRTHKFVIRYADSTTTASSTWTVWNETGVTTTATFTVPASASTDLGKGEAYITPSVTIPTSTDDWSLRVQVPSGVTIQIYEILLAAYDKVK